MARMRVANPALNPTFERLARASDIGRHRIDYASRLPLGSFFHKLVARLVARQTDGIARQLREYAAAVDDVLLALGEQAGGREGLNSLSHRVDLVLEKVATYERSGSGARSDVRELTARVRDLQAVVDRSNFAPWFSQDEFERSFRGSRQDVLESLRPLIPYLLDCGPVLDFGCGRGEMLELLREQGVEAHGVELDAALVEAVRARGLSAEVGDGMVYLSGRSDASLGGLYLGQVIEHLTPQQAVDLVALASLKLRPGGRLIVETVNNQSLYVFSHSFYVDPTHVRPVPPAYLLFLAQQAGFADWRIEWRSPVQQPERLEALPRTGTVDPDLIDKLNVNLERINEAVFGPQDYALIATR